MALQIAGFTPANIMETDATFKAARATLRPPEAVGWYSVGLKSGALTGLAAGAPLFTLRNLASNLLMVRRIGVGFLTTTAFLAPQIVDFGLTGARAFTASDSGGNAVTLTGTNNSKHRTSLAAPTNFDMRIAGAAALTAGTRTLDAAPMASVAAFSGALGAGLAPAPGNLLQHDASDYPLILALNEGLVITALTAFGATGVGTAYVNIEFAEAVAF